MKWRRKNPIPNGRLANTHTKESYNAKTKLTETKRRKLVEHSEFLRNSFYRNNAGDIGFYAKCYLDHLSVLAGRFHCPITRLHSLFCLGECLFSLLCKRFLVNFHLLVLFFAYSCFICSDLLSISIGLRPGLACAPSPFVTCEITHRMRSIAQ